MRTRALYLTGAAVALIASAAPAEANPWFPLKPGTTYVYNGTDSGAPVRDVFRITHRTKVIQGVRCRVIDDRLYKRGRLRERTTDYYAEDATGNVRYYGEDTAELNRRGHVTSREGSWRAGRDGAQSGIFMPAHPRVGSHGFQERYPGHAEDQFRVVRRHGGVLVTHEHTRLEPGVLDEKRYRRGIGGISEDSLKGGDEHLDLVAVRHR
jgi:hypothetical protein